MNDAPVNTVPGAQSVAEDTALPIAGVSVADVDSGALSTTLDVLHGTLTVIDGPGVSGNGTGSVTITGTAAQINAALAGPLYRQPQLQRRRHAHDRDHRRGRRHRHRHDRNHRQCSERRPGAQSRRGPLDDRWRGLSDLVHRRGRSRPHREHRRPDHRRQHATGLRDGYAHEPRHPRRSGVHGTRRAASSRPTIPAPTSSRSRAPRRLPTIRRRCTKSRSTTPVPRRRPIPASSTWSSMMERPQATWRERSSRSPKSTTVHPPSISTPTIRRSPVLPGRGFRATFTENGTSRDCGHRYADHRCRRHGSRLRRPSR